MTKNRMHRRNLLKEELIPLNADLYLLGSGVKSFTQLTLETQYILKRCKELYYAHDIPSLKRYLKEMHPNPVNLLNRFYIDGRDRRDIYNEFCQFIIGRAGEVSQVAFLIHGHPLFFSTVSQLILTEAERRDLKVRVLSGVSSFDTIFTDMKIDVGERGTQVLGAYTLVHKEVILNPKMDTILLQIAAFENIKAERTKKHSSGQLKPLKDKLLEFYPPRHPVSIIESAVDLERDAFVRVVPLDEIDQCSFPLLYNHSMFIPAVS